MRTIEEIKREIREAEQKLYRLKNEVFDIEFFDNVDKYAYKEIQEKILFLQSEINNDILYIKTTYNQLLSIRTSAELLVRRNNDPDAIETSKKIHQAFIMLIEYNKLLENKIDKFNALLTERETFLEKSKYRDAVLKAEDNIIELRKKLRDAESQNSESAKAKNNVVKELQEYEDQIYELDNKINEIELWREHDSKKCAACNNIPLKIIKTKKGTVMYGCPNWTPNEPDGNHDHAWCTDEQKQQAPEKLKQLEELYYQKKQLKSTPPKIDFEKIKGTLRHTSINFDDYPNILETSYNNYLFQSLAVPSGTPFKENFNELLRYSRFRIFTKLQSHEIDDSTRTVYSLALRLMNRGVVLGTNEKTEAKINRCFENSAECSKLVLLNEYVSYSTPQNSYDKTTHREKEFAEYYFPKVLGKAWATYVYPQMLISSLVSEDRKKDFVGQRVDFFVCFGGKKIVIELDGNEDHEEKIESDKDRAAALEANGCIVLRFSNEKVDNRSNEILNCLKSKLIKRPDGAIVNISPKHLLACKLVHQVSIAILKMLEEGHLTSQCNLDIEISSDLFSEKEQKLLLLFATEEISEMIDNFAKLYGVEINLNFFDENAEKYWIRIGDGDNNLNSIIIRDIVLPINYLCSLHPFALVLPDTNAIPDDRNIEMIENEESTEDVKDIKKTLEYFLKYVYGYPKFRQGQLRAICRALRQKESIVLLPTGSGKSVIYQLSSMLLPGITVVISPLRALIDDQVNNLAERGINNVASIFSADEKSTEEMIKKAKAIMNNHSAMMLYIAPERMQMPAFRNDIKMLKATNNFCLVAIDEAHCVSEWGHDFRAPYLQIGRSCREIFKKEDFSPAIVALTGTASDNVLKDVKRDLVITNDDAIISPSDFDRPELHFSIMACRADEKFENLKHLLKKGISKKLNITTANFNELCGNQTVSGIVFTPLAKKTRDIYSAWVLFNDLQQSGIKLKTGTYFSEPPASLNSKNAKEIWEHIKKSYARDFKENRNQLLVATKAFGMGIDKPNIRYVVHYGLSTSIEQYYQEVGRAGRDGKHSECVMLFSAPSAEFEKLLDPNESWENFDSLYKKSLEEHNLKNSDLSPLLYFHSNNFKGKDFEKDILYALLNCLKTASSNFTQDIKKPISVDAVYSEYLKTKNKKRDDNIDIIKNNVARAIIRLVTLGVVEDYEYNFSQNFLQCKYSKCRLGSIKREHVLSKYLEFVEGCSIGRSNSEKKHLDQYAGDDLGFLNQVIEQYVDLVYGTIERGRRRALYSMFILAKKATEPQNANNQDKFIRSEINNYLVKDDVVDLVKSSTQYAGIFEILNAYPLYSNDVVLKSRESEIAKKTSGYADKTLVSDPFHTGLLYLRAITSIKSKDYHDASVVTDIVEAYKNSEKYSIPQDVSIEFLVKVMNLTFNSSCELFNLLWDKIDSKSVNRIIESAIKMSGDDISEHFKDYLLLHVATQSLHKMIGDK